MFGEGTMDGLEQSLENTVMKCLGILRNCHILWLLHLGSSSNNYMLHGIVLYIVV